MPTRNPADWIALNLLSPLGPLRVRRLLERVGEPAVVAHRLPLRALGAIAGLRAAGLAEIAEARRTLPRRAERELRRAAKLGLRVLACDDADYPAELQTLADAPIVLYVRGELPPACVRIAVVGSRQATSYGKRVATGLGLGLAARGIEVVSGGARGIDTCAHLGALEEGGRTVAVLGSGFGRPYPRENEELFERIAAAGAVISEFPLDRPPRKENFPRRNRIVSGLAAAVVVVEAARRSGSLVTAGHALEQGREVLAIPGPVSSDRSVGCHALIQQGAKLVQNVDDILDELSPMYRGAIGPAPDPRAVVGDAGPGTPDEESVLALLDPVEPLHLDELAERAPFGIARLHAALFGLELRGVVEVLPGGHYRALGSGAGLP